MMKLWKQRNLQRTVPTTSAVFSVVAHAALIAVAVAGSGPRNDAVETLSAHSLARLLLPPNRPAGEVADPEVINYVAIAIPEGVLEGSIQPDEIKPLDLLGALDARDAVRLPELPGADSIFLMVEVDSIAERYEWSAAPAYPPGMLEQKIEGSVQAQYVVNEDGYADTASFRVLLATNPEFSKAVRDALPYMRFKPARVGRNTVRQLVEQEFRFRIAVADSQGSGKPQP